MALDIRSFDSIAQVGRDFVAMMKETGIPFEVFDFHLSGFAGSFLSDRQVDDCLALAVDQIHSRNIILFANKPVPVPRGLHCAITPFWEFQEGLPEVSPTLLKSKKQLVAFSDFCFDYFKKVASKDVSVHKIRYPYLGARNVMSPRDEVRRAYGVPTDAFVCFFHFNLGSSVERKNPRGALQAFAKAFAGTEDRAHLVLKVAGAPRTSELYRSVECQVSEAGLGGHVTLINECLTHDALLDLIASADVYMSLHRGEGFGIGMLEAISVGTPVVCTNYGGNTDFCKPDTSFLVDYQMVENTSADSWFRFVRKWPEPNVNQAAHYLREIFEKPELGVDKAKSALKFVEQFFDRKRFADDVRHFMKKDVAHG